MLKGYLFFHSVLLSTLIFCSENNGRTKLAAQQNQNGSVSYAMSHLGWLVCIAELEHRVLEFELFINGNQVSSANVVANAGTAVTSGQSSQIPRSVLDKELDLLKSGLEFLNAKKRFQLAVLARNVAARTSKIGLEAFKKDNNLLLKTGCFESADFHKDYTTPVKVINIHGVVAKELRAMIDAFDSQDE